MCRVCETHQLRTNSGAFHAPYGNYHYRNYQTGVIVMTVAEQQTAGTHRPFLRVYRGPETARPDGMARPDRQPPWYYPDDRAELYWAGRIPALRRSARIAA